MDLISSLGLNVQSFLWQCPHCEHHATISNHDFSLSDNYFKITDGNDIESGYNVQTKTVVCPNEECRKYVVYISIYKAHTKPNVPYGIDVVNDEFLMGTMYHPNAKIKKYPNYIPEAVLNDYREAVLISELSPKASATISRRCLQGIIRDYWKVKPGKLFDEIFEIAEKIDRVTYDAIDSIRKIGNIGAHMEKDINLIIDVDPNEAKILISLIELLIESWYIARHDKEERLLKIKAIADNKSM